MKHLAPFGQKIKIEPVVLNDSTLLFIHRDSGRERTCIVTPDELFGYIATGSDDFTACVLPLDADIDAWAQQNFACERTQIPIRSIILFGKEASCAWEDLCGEKDDEQITGALDEVNKILESASGELVIREFKTEEERNAYYRGMADADGWEGHTDFVLVYPNPFTEEDIQKHLSWQNGIGDIQ